MPTSTPPEVSFVIPARDEERLIGGALASVAAQAGAAVEAVVADNGSRDATLEVVSRWTRLHPEVPVRWVIEPIIGRGRAKNRGAAVARGRLLVFLDGDSRADPGLARAVVEAAEAGFAAGSIRIAADSGDPVDRAYFDLIEWGKALFGIKAQMFFCDRAVFLSLGGFDPELQIGEDVEFLRRLQRAGHPACHLSSVAIHTSPRRLHAGPLRIGLALMFGRWALAHAGIGRRWRY